MQSVVRHLPTRLVEYDSNHRRIWILGQRCHHGAAGTVVAAGACLEMILHRDASMVALVATGAALMVHDWDDRSHWFERGRGSQR